MSTYTVMVKLTIHANTKAQATTRLLRHVVQIEADPTVLKVEHGPIARNP